VVEGEPGCVEELPLEAEIARDTVHGIAGHRQVDRSQMHADLMRAPGLEPDA
jgi:hypothetical protein